MSELTTMRLGEKIRARRHERGWTLDDLAGQCKVSKPYLSLIETNRVKKPPATRKLIAIENALGFQPNELVHQADIERIPVDVLERMSRRLDEGKIVFVHVQGPTCAECYRLRWLINKLRTQLLDLADLAGRQVSAEVIQYRAEDLRPQPGLSFAPVVQ